MAMDVQLHFANLAVMALTALKRLRKKANLTLEALSEMTEISVSQISRYESGARDPSLSDLRKLSETLGAPIAVLADDVRMIPVVGYVGAGAEIYRP